VILRLFLAALALVACGCSSSFDHAWALSQPGGTIAKDGRPGAPSPIRRSQFDGRWSGRWTSDQHRALFSRKPESGAMRLVLAKTAPGKYRANVRAHWLVFRSDYEVLLDGEERARVLRLRGIQNVRPIFGGPYRYDAVVMHTGFTMRYDSRYDRGKVELAR